LRQPSAGWILCLTLGAWIALQAAAPGGLTVGLVTLCMAAVLFGAGQAILRLLHGRGRDSAEHHLLALAAGLIALGGTAHAAYYLRIPDSVFLLCAGLLAAVGWALAAGSLRRCARQPVSFGWLFIAVFMAIVLIYFVPKSQRDGAPLPDGSVQWMYPDTAFHEAIVGVVAREDPPLTNPGSFQVVWAYHIARHALAKAMVNVFGISVSDALERGVHALALLALGGAAIALGRTTALCEGQKSLAGLLGAVSVFFLPTLRALWHPETHSCSRYAQIPIPWLRNFGALSWDAWMGHFVVGSSVLWAAIVAIGVAALLNFEPPGTMDPSTRRKLPWAALLLSVLGISLNGVAGVCCVMVTVGLVLWEGWRRWKAWMFALAAVSCYLAFNRVIGLDGTQARLISASPFRVDGMVVRMAQVGIAGFTILLGLRGLAILTFLVGMPRSARVLAISCAAYLGVQVVFFLQNYPVFILGVLLGGYAAAPLADLLQAVWAGGPMWPRAWFGFVECYRRYAGLLLPAAALLFPPFLYPMLRGKPLASIRNEGILLCAVIVAALILWRGLHQVLRSNWTPSPGRTGMVLAAVSLLSAAGVLRCCINYGWDWLGNSVQLDGGRVASLAFLEDTAPRLARLATTHHAVDVAQSKDRSYLYGATCQRYLLLEGWEYGEAKQWPGFETLLDDNQRLFSTTREAEARQIVRRYGITHILVEPGESLGIDLAAATWLKPEPNPGTLTILAVDLEAIDPIACFEGKANTQ